jgi:hypothetical protein
LRSFLAFLLFQAVLLDMSDYTLRVAQVKSICTFLLLSTSHEQVFDYWSVSYSSVGYWRVSYWSVTRLTGRRIGRDYQVRAYQD